MRAIAVSHKDDFVEGFRNPLNEHVHLFESVVVDYDENSFDKVYDKIKSIHKDNNYILMSYCEGLLLGMKSLSTLNIPLVLRTGDCWSRLLQNGFKKIVDKHKPSIILVNNKCTIPAFKDYLDNYEAEYIWSKIPYDDTYIKDYGEQKIYDIGFSGKFSDYDDRRNINHHLTYRDDLNYKRFGFVPTIEEYAKNINRCKLSYSSMQNSGKLYYKSYFIGTTHRKNIEISACGTGLITREWGDAEEMGYKDGENCILFNDWHEFTEKLEYYLHNREELNKIIHNGKKLVIDKYDYKTCTVELCKEIEESLKNV